jgi:exopolysaccharide production protein ExoZ
MDRPIVHFRSLQFLRAIAAVGVVFFHEFLGQFTIGAAGVDIFFVMSGFLIGKIGLKEKPREFFLKRLIRIAPLYWLITFFMCLGAFIPGMYSHFSFNGDQLLQSLLFIPYYNQVGDIYPLVVPGWTLNYEMFFYVIFSLALLTRWPTRVFLVSMAVLPAIGYILKPEAAPFKIWTDPLLLEFIAGFLISQCPVTKNAKIGSGLMLFGLAAFAIQFYFNQDNMPRIILWGIPAAALVWGALIIETAKQWPKLRALEIIGDSSYSLYLIHGIVISFVHKFWGHELWIQLPAVFVGSIGAAYLCWRYIEIPINRHFRRRVLQSGSPKNRVSVGV